jgi:hypothetical protein
MTIYNVHLYREMRLFFPGVDADSHEAAAEIARQQPTDKAQGIEDCDGNDTAALVDVAGDRNAAADPAARSWPGRPGHPGATPLLGSE